MRRGSTSGSSLLSSGSVSCFLLPSLFAPYLSLTGPVTPPPSSSSPSSALSIASERNLAGPNCLCNKLGWAVTVGYAIVSVYVFTFVYMCLQGITLYFFSGSLPHENTLEAVLAASPLLLLISCANTQTHTIVTLLSDPPAPFHSREQREEVEQEANGYVCLPICPWHDQLISRLIHCHHGLITFPFKLLMDFFEASSLLPICPARAERGGTVEVRVCGRKHSPA